MYLAYFDESGDDGFPNTSSNFFILSSLYMEHQQWKSNYQLLYTLRKDLKERYDLPIKQEFHSKQFLLDKNPYHGIYDPRLRRSMFFEYLKGITGLQGAVINVVINKDKISKSGYDIMDNAFTYSIQRIENDILKKSSKNNFMIICDKGRLGKMRRTARRVQKYNYIPSKYYPGNSYRKEIKTLIEDPLEKDSKNSYFIQVCDAVAYIINLYATVHLKQSGSWPNRLIKVLQKDDELKMLDILMPLLNTSASGRNK